MAQKPAPDDAQQSQPLWLRQAESILETQIARYPFLVQSRAVMRQLEHERKDWPWLLPLLAVLFFFTYRSARKKVLEVERNLRD